MEDILTDQFNVKIVIFSFNREEMLIEQLNHLSKFDCEILIVDDASDFDAMKYNQEAAIYISKENKGKKKFYKQWQIALEYLKEDKKDQDMYIFMPDDFSSLELSRMIQAAYMMNNNEAWLINLINDGRTECFAAGKPRETKIGNEDFLKINWTDCGFFCNKKLLEELDYWIEDIDAERFWRNDSLSSGVGHQLTNRLKHVARMYLPIKSFAQHGEHESKMHKEERKKNPLISKH